jgi:glutathione S-transferase
MGKAPMLVTEDGTCVIESGAISEYIVEKYASEKQKKAMYGGGSLEKKAEVRSWMYWSEGTLLLHSLVSPAFLLRRVINSI